MHKKQSAINNGQLVISDWTLMGKKGGLEVFMPRARGLSAGAGVVGAYQVIQRLLL
jgi:hypothetical protein